MTTYLLYSKSKNFECSFSYTDYGLLVGFEVKTQFSDKEKHESFLQYNFSKYETLKAFSKRFEKEFKLDEIPPDLSFENVWETYGYKVGKKDRAKRLWEALTDKEKMLCLQAIPRYKAWLAYKNIEMLYLETFLSQKRFLNEFR